MCLDGVEFNFVLNIVLQANTENVDDAIWLLSFLCGCITTLRIVLSLAVIFICVYIERRTKLKRRRFHWRSRIYSIFFSSSGTKFSARFTKSNSDGFFVQTLFFFLLYFQTRRKRLNTLLYFLFFRCFFSSFWNEGIFLCKPTDYHLKLKQFFFFEKKSPTDWFNGAMWMVWSQKFLSEE